MDNAFKLNGYSCLVTQHACAIMFSLILTAFVVSYCVCAVLVVLESSIHFNLHKRQM